MTSKLGRGLGPYVLVAGVGAVLMGWRLGLCPLEGHECLVAVTARTMSQPDQWLDPMANDRPPPPNTTLNHWLVPVFNGQPRVIKTPMAYWCVGALAKIGLPLDEVTVRLPSLVSALGFLLVTLALGRRMFGPRAGLIGAMVLATSMGVFRWGRNARPEMLLCFWITAAMACFYVGVHARTAARRHAWWMAAWTAVGLAHLAKEFVPFLLAWSVLAYLAWRSADAGPEFDGRGRRGIAVLLGLSTVGLLTLTLILAVPALHWWRVMHLGETRGRIVTSLVMLAAPLVWYLIRCRAHRQLQRLLPSAVPGTAIMLLLFVPWMWYMARLFPQTQAMIWQDVGTPVLGIGGWSQAQAPGTYLASLGLMLLPWVAFIPGAVAIPFMKRFRADRDALVFLVCWVVGLALLLSASTRKRAHYVLPALPAMALLMGYCAEEVLFKHRWFSRRNADRLVTAHAVVGVLAIVTVLVAVMAVGAGAKARFLHVLLLVDIAAVPMCAAMFAFRQGHGRTAVALLVAAAGLGLVGFATRADLWQREASAVVVARQAAHLVPSTAPVALWPEHSAPLIFYFGRDIPDALRARDRLTRLHGQQEGRRLWRHWLCATSPARWVFARNAHRTELATLGFDPVAPIPPASANDDWALFRHTGPGR